MSPDTILLVCGAAVAGFVQGLSGFAFGMVSMAIWVWGIEPRMAVVMAVFGGLTGQTLSAFTVRRGLNFATLLPFLLGGLVGIPIGVSMLPHLDPALFKLVLGMLLVVCCPLMLMAGRLPKVEFGGRIADALAGLAGGVSGGIGGFTGAIPTLWCSLRQYDKDLQRTVIQNFNLAALAATMSAYLFVGAVTREMLPKFALVAPALVLPSMLGARIYAGLSPAAFRRIVLVLLTASGIAMLVSSLPGLLR